MARHTALEATYMSQFERKAKIERPELHLSQAERHPGRGPKPRPAVSLLAKTCGFARRSDVPPGAGRPKVCKTCQSWFVARPYEQVCDDCVPAPERAKRLGRVVSRGERPKSPMEPQVRAH